MAGRCPALYMHPVQGVLESSVTGGMSDTVPTSKGPSFDYTLSPPSPTLPWSTTGDSPAVEAPSTSSKTWVVLGPWADSLSQSTDTLCSNTPPAQCGTWCGPGFSLDGALQYSQAALSRVSTLLAEAAAGILCPSNHLVLVMKTCVIPLHSSRGNQEKCSLVRLCSHISPVF